jgi:hypothetical protein
MTANSWLEICATSAIGRALADLDFAKKGKRPSREEMVKAKGHEAKPVAEPKHPADFYMVQAFEASQNKDLEKLRKIYADAVADNQDKEVLESLTKLAKEIQ